MLVLLASTVKFVRYVILSTSISCVVTVLVLVPCFVSERMTLFTGFVNNYAICPLNREIKCTPIRAIGCTIGVTQKYSGGIAYAQKGGLYDH